MCRVYGKMTKSSKNKKLYLTFEQTNKKRIKRLNIIEKQKQEFYINLA